MQSVNFFFLPASLRVVWVAACSFAWVNILCCIRREEEKNVVDEEDWRAVKWSPGSSVDSWHPVVYLSGFLALCWGGFSGNFVRSGVSGKKLRRLSHHHSYFSQTIQKVNDSEYDEFWCQSYLNLFSRIDVLSFCKKTIVGLLNFYSSLVKSTIELWELTSKVFAI